jgi:hypothetical protein
MFQYPNILFMGLKIHEMDLSGMWGKVHLGYPVQNLMHTPRNYESIRTIVAIGYKVSWRKA